MKKMLMLVLLPAMTGCIRSEVKVTAPVRQDVPVKEETKKTHSPSSSSSVSVPENVQSSAGEEKKGYSSSDLRRSANTVVNNMVRSGALDNPSGDRYVVTTGRIVNKTKETFKTDEIVADIKSALAVTRKVRVVGSGSKNPAPKLIVSGSITHRIGHVRGKERHEYYLRLNVTDLGSGTSLWEGETPIVRRTAGVKDSKTR